jgi:hypothetical protein
MCKWLLMLCLAPVAVWAEEAPVAAADEPVTRNPVALVRAGAVEDEIVERVKSWAESQLAIPVPLAESMETKADSLNAVADEAAARVGPDDLGLIVLFQSETPVPNHGIFRPEQRVVVVNVGLMREGADEEKFGRRMERQVIRGIGTLMGLELSPNPESAMCMYSTMEELDQMGRNLDPPWLYQLQQKAREFGVPLDPDNPFNMLGE